MEVCVDSVKSALNAENGGADRLELCCGLSVGGLTPSVGLLKVVKCHVDIPVFALIRPRRGDFLYDSHDVDVMKGDITALKSSGVDGFVIGSLNADGTVNEEICGELIDVARPLPVTFHRAIDMTVDPLAALDTIVHLGCSRVLSSGSATSALDGIDTLKKMVRHSPDIIVMPGGGITDQNLARIIRETSVEEFHSSAKRTVISGMTFRRGDVTMGATSGCEFSLSVTDEEAVRRMKCIAKQLWVTE